MREVLRPAGFRKQGLTFFADRGDVLLLVNLQSSSSTSKIRMKITVNLGAFSRVIAGEEGAPPNARSLWDAHWRERIGCLAPKREDKWWTVESDAEAEEAGAAIASILRDKGLAALETLCDAGALNAAAAKQNPRRFGSYADGKRH